MLPFVYNVRFDELKLSQIWGFRPIIMRVSYSLISSLSVWRNSSVKLSGTVSFVRKFLIIHVTFFNGHRAVQVI